MIRTDRRFWTTRKLFFCVGTLLPALSIAQGEGSGSFPTHLVAISIAVLVLLLLAVWGTLQLWAANRLLQSEQDVLHTAERLRHENTDEPFLKALAERVAPHTAVGRACDATRTAARLGASLAQVGEYASEAERAVESRSLAARNIAQISVYIGLFGTLIGLWLAVQQLNRVPSIRGPQDLRLFGEATRAMFGSFGWAFSSAGAGILVTVILSLLVSGFDDRAGKFRRELERFLLSAVAPAAKTVTEQNRPLTEVGLMEKLVRDLDELLSRALNGFQEAGALTHTAAINFESAAKKSVEAVGGIDRAAGQIASGAEALRIVSEQSGQHRGELAGSISGVRSALAEIQVILERFEVLTKGWERQIPALTESTLQLKRSNDLAAQVLPGFKTELGQANDQARKDLVRLSGAMVDHLEETRRVLDSQAAYLNDVGYLVREVPGAVREGIGSVKVDVSEQNLHLDLKPLLDQIRHLEISLTNGINRLDESIQSQVGAEIAPATQPFVANGSDPEVLRLLANIQSELVKLNGKENRPWWRRGRGEG